LSIAIQSYSIFRVSVVVNAVYRRQCVLVRRKVHIEQLQPQFDDKLFEVTDKRLRRNILGAFNNVPEALVSASDGALFGTNAETYKEMKLFYSEQTEEEREKLQETLSYLGFPCIIEPIVKRETPATNV